MTTELYEQMVKDLDYQYRQSITSIRGILITNDLTTDEKNLLMMHILNVLNDMIVEVRKYTK